MKKIVKNRQNLAVRFFLISLLFAFILILPCSAAGRNEGARPRALLLAGDRVGWAYYDIKEIMERLGWEVVTLGYGSDVYACGNKEERKIPVDIALMDFDKATLRDYHALIIPAGAHFRLLSSSEKLLTLINDAFEQKLVIGAQCAGVVVLSHSDFIKGRSVASFYMADSGISAAGGTVVYNSVVVDGRIVTAGAGGGPRGGGYERAHLEEFCAAIDAVIH